MDDDSFVKACWRIMFEFDTEQVIPISIIVKKLAKATRRSETECYFIVKFSLTKPIQIGNNPPDFTDPLLWIVPSPSRNVLVKINSYWLKIPDSSDYFKRSAPYY